jgi:hypothetical protein
MDSLSASTIVMILAGVLVTVFILVVVFYKPPRQLKVNSNYKSGSGDNNSLLELEIINVGKTREKIMPPYLKFSSGFSTKKYQVGKESVNCKYPRVIKPGERMVCEIDLSQYQKSLEKDDFKATHLVVVVDDMVGMEFKSESLEV